MALSKINLSAQIVEYKKPLQLVEKQIPNLSKNEVLIKMEFAGLCHTDLHVQSGDWKFKSNLPLTLGHEGVGRIVGIGEGVKHLKIGDRVCSSWVHDSCGACDQCWTGWETVCDQQVNTGFTTDGTFAQHMVAKADFLGRVPDTLTSEQAVPISCAGVTAYKAIKESGVRPGQWIVFVGAAGGLGHVGVQYAKAMGIKVLGIDCGESKLQFLEELGCDASVDGARPDLIPEILRITGGGAHGCIILVSQPKCVSDAIIYLRKRGVIVLVALPPGSFTVNYLQLVIKAITIKGSISGNRLDLDEALRIAGEGRIKCNIQMRPFREINAAMEELNAGNVSGRLVLDISQI